MQLPFTGFDHATGVAIGDKIPTVRVVQYHLILSHRIVSCLDPKVRDIAGVMHHEKSALDIQSTPQNTEP